MYKYTMMVLAYGATRLFSIKGMSHCPGWCIIDRHTKISPTLCHTNEQSTCNMWTKGLYQQSTVKLKSQVCFFLSLCYYLCVTCRSFASYGLSLQYQQFLLTTINLMGTTTTMAATITMAMMKLEITASIVTITKKITIITDIPITEIPMYISLHMTHHQWS